MAKRDHCHCKGCFKFYGNLFNDNVGLRQCHRLSIERQKLLAVVNSEAIVLLKRHREVKLCPFCKSSDLLVLDKNQAKGIEAYMTSKWLWVLL